MKNEKIRSDILSVITDLKTLNVNKYFIRRNYTDVSEKIFGIDYISYSEIHSQIMEWAMKENVSMSDIHISFEYDESSAGFDEAYLVISIERKENDEQYFQRLYNLFENTFRTLSVNSSDWAQVFWEISNVMYVARHITCDTNKVSECLGDIDKMYNARNNDHNGEATDYELLLKQRAVYSEMKAKYC